MKLPPALPNVTHTLTIYEEQNGDFQPFLLTLDSRMVVLSKIPKEPTPPSPAIPAAPADARRQYLDAHGYQYEETNGALVIKNFPQEELALFRVLTDDTAILPGVRLEQCQNLRAQYRNALKQLEEANPDCTDCEKGSVTRRFLDLARKMMDNSKNASFVVQKPGAGN